MYLIDEVGEVDEDGLAVMCAKATATGENMTSMETKKRRTNFKKDRREWNKWEADRSVIHLMSIWRGLGSIIAVVGCVLSFSIANSPRRTIF
jgi:hypothetical protein